MNKVSDSTKPPAVPRRTQSAKVVSSYRSSGRALRATNENEEQDTSRQPTRRWSQKNKTRRSLDAMEQQADELFDFLSDLESKKASCSDTDFLTFLSDSKSPSGSPVNHAKSFEKSPNVEKTSPKLPSRAKRVSVKDKAKLFLQSDIKEEAIEDTSTLNKPSVTKKIQGSNRFKAVSQRNSNNNNNASMEIKTSNFHLSQSNSHSAKHLHLEKSTVSITCTNKKADLKLQNSTPNISTHTEKTDNLQTTLNSRNSNGATSKFSGSPTEIKTVSATFEYTDTQEEVVAFAGSSDSDLSSEESESLSEAELSLNSTPRSSSPFNQSVDQEDTSTIASTSELRESGLNSVGHSASHASINLNSESGPEFSDSESPTKNGFSESVSPPELSEDFDRCYFSGVCFSC